MHIIHYKGRMYHCDETGEIHCLYDHPKSTHGAPTWRKVSPTGRVAWEIRKRLAKEKEKEKV